jgi:hypothetical protein
VYYSEGPPSISPGMRSALLKTFGICIREFHPHMPQACLRRSRENAPGQGKRPHHRSTLGSRVHGIYELLALSCRLLLKIDRGVYDKQTSPHYTPVTNEWGLYGVETCAQKQSLYSRRFFKVMDPSDSTSSI